MKSGRFWAWVVFAVGAAYFFIPLIATLEFSMRMRRGVYSFDAYKVVFGDPRFQQTFGFSVAGRDLHHHRRRADRRSGRLLDQAAPAAAAAGRRVHHAPAAGHPGDRHRLRLHPHVRVELAAALPGERARGTDVLLVFGYATLALPYMYRAVDTGLRTIDVRTLTEAAQILGAGWTTIITRVILPNVLIAVLSGAFLTFAIVIGEFTMASLLNRPAFGPYLQNIGANRAYEPAALAIIAFAITWGCMSVIQLLSRFAPRSPNRPN